MSELDLIRENKRDFQKIIRFLFDMYEIDKLNCKVVLTNRENPEYFAGRIMLNGNLSHYLQLDFQFAHELTHAIQHHQKRALKHEIRLTVSGGYEQVPYPNHSFQETEAVANSIWVIEKVLKYDNYNARTRENPEYYDYDKAFILVDDGRLKEIWNMNHHIQSYGEKSRRSIK